jgi:RimJ/RimL family protein N-acetyltransferase
MNTVTMTERLRLREFAFEDAAFVCELLNDPDFITQIADRGVRTIADAERYLADGPMASYARHGFGLWGVETLDGQRSAGMCGLIRREGLSDPDIGYAFLPAFRGAGYAREAARATCALARPRFGIERLLAIVSPGNAPSIRLLQDLGFGDEGTVRLQPEASALRLFALMT